MVIVSAAARAWVSPRVLHRRRCYTGSTGWRGRKDDQGRDEQGQVFLDHGGIWLLELSKFAAAVVETEQQRWLKFFNEAERLDDDALPNWMQTPEMMQAMTTLKVFSDKERAYHSYQARQNYLREQRSVQRELDQLNAELAEVRATRDSEQAAKEQAVLAEGRERAAKEQERTAKEDALAEVERIKRLLGGADHLSPDA